MYGATNTGEFSHIGGPEDHGLELLFFWNDEEELLGIGINVACPSQVIEGRSVISADFWHEVREELRKRYRQDMFVYPMTGASGDQAPDLMFRQEAEKRLRERRHGSQTTIGGRDETVMEETADRIANAIDYVYEGAANDLRKSAG